MSCSVLHCNASAFFVYIHKVNSQFPKLPNKRFFENEHNFSDTQDGDTDIDVLTCIRHRARNQNSAAGVHTLDPYPRPPWERALWPRHPQLVFLPAHHSHKFPALRTCIASHSQKYDARVIWNLMWCIILCCMAMKSKSSQIVLNIWHQLLSMTCVHYYICFDPSDCVGGGKIIFIIPWCKNLHRLETFKFVDKNKTFSMINIYLAEKKNIFQPLV